MNSWRRIYLVTISSVRPSVRIGSSPLRKAVTSAVNGHRYNNVNLSLRVKRNETRRNFSTHGPDKPDAAARDTAAERDLRILREQSQELSQDDAMEAWRCLLEAACVDGAPADVFFALGELHYNWGDLLELGRRAELGAEGAARAVVGEIKHLRKHAMRKRRETEGAAPARRAERSGTRHADEEFPADPENEVGPWGNHREAWEWYLKAADLGDSRAMMQLGNIMIENKTAVDADLAFEWYRKASTSGQPDALFQIARMHHEGIGVPINSPHAREMYEEACEAGSSSAAFFLGHCNHHGNPNLGIEPDGKRALQLLQKASEQGHAEAVFYLAQAYRSGSPEMCLPQDLAKFSQMVVQSAAKGSADAMFTAGAAYFHGEDSFPRDPRAAFQYYSAAAAQGHADGNYCLGVMYYTTGDLEAAFRCYQTAAEGGNMLAWRNLASMYALGEGVPRSEQMAKHIMTTLRDKIDEQEASESEKDAKNGSDPPRS